MAEANPGKTFQLEKNEESETSREHLESVRNKMQERSSQAQRSKNQVTIFLYGISGDGKSSTLNYLFDANIIPTGKVSQTRNVTDYGCSLKGSPWFGAGLNIGFIDTPGFDDTRGGDSDAENLAKISHFLGKVDHVFPNIVLIVVSALGNRLDGVNSRFSKMLHVLTKLNIVDTRRPNVVIVVTNAMHFFTKEKYVFESKNIIAICQLLARAHFSIEVPVVFIENLDKKKEMQQEGEWLILPDGTKQPLNLFDAMINLMKLSGDEVGVEAIRLFFSESRKYEVKEIRKNPVNLDVKKDCPEWAGYIKENFFSNEKNEIYSIFSDKFGPDSLQTFPLVYHLQKIKLVETSHLRKKNLMEIKRTLHPFQLTQQEIEWLIRFDVSPLMRTELDFKSLGLGYSRQLNEKRNRILEIGPLEIVECGDYEIPIPKHCIAKVLKQMTIEIVYDENATWFRLKYLKLIFRIRYVLFQVDVDHLEHFKLNPKFISSLERSLPKGVDTDNLECKFENPNFTNFIKEYALHCTTGLYFGGFIEGELYFNRRSDVEASIQYLAEKSASLLTQLETYFSCIQNGTIPQQANFLLDAETSKKLLKCNLTCKGGNSYFNSKKILDITVREWNNWIHSIGEKAVCFDKTVNSSSIRDVLVSSKDEKISSYAREFECITTGKETDLNNLRFEVSLNFTAGIGSDSEMAYQEKKEVHTRIEAADKV